MTVAIMRRTTSESQTERPGSGERTHPVQATRRQLDVLVAIREFAASFHYQPSIRELGERLGIKSTNGVHDHLKALERKGLVTRNPMTARSLVLTDLGHELAGVL